MANLYQTTMQLPWERVAAKRNQKKKTTIAEDLMNLYVQIIYSGTTKTQADSRIKYIRITNFIASTTILTAVLYIFFALLWGNTVWLMTLIGLGASGVGVVLLNKKGHTNTSRIFYLLSLNLFIYLGSVIVGPLAHSENFFMVSIIIPFLIFEIERPVWISTGIIVPVVLYCLYHYTAPAFSDFYLTTNQQIFLNPITRMLEFSHIIVAVYLFIYYSRRAEQALQRSNYKLSKQTAELKRSNGDLEQFAYVISHDLKTPVRNISCFMKLLSGKYGESLEPEAREFVDYSQKGAKRMEQLIDDVLAYSRIGRNMAATTAVSLDEVISTIKFELAENMAQVNGSIVLAKPLPTVRNAHSTMMHHIFYNLIKNGLKFNDSEAPTVTIDWEETADQYTLIVADNGIGIAKEYSNQVFQMFKRLHNENEYDGTGIGLAICKKIAEYYHGKIWFESEAGKGTRFYFTLPK